MVIISGVPIFRIFTVCYNVMVNGYTFRGSNLVSLKFCLPFLLESTLNAIHSERPKPHRVLAVPSAIGLKEELVKNLHHVGTNVFPL